MWTKEQQNAIDIQDKNLLVSASAGSGKTAVLVERVIQKIMKYRVDIDKILVVTFTNAAANELKERLLAAIYKKIEEEPDNYFLKRQVSLLSRASITTIDAFCIELVRSNFHVLNIDPNFKISTNTQSAILKNKVMTKLLEEEYSHTKENDENAKWLYKILEMFGGKDEKLIETLFNLYTYIQSFPYPFEYLKESIEKYHRDHTNSVDLAATDFGDEILLEVKSNLKILVKQIEDMKNLLEQKDEFTKHVELLEDDLNYVNRCIYSAHSWDQLYETLFSHELGSNIVSRKITDVVLKDKIKDFRNKIPKKTIEDSKKSIYATTKEILADNEKAYEYVEYLYHFLYRFDEEYMTMKNDMGLLEFNDIHHIALELLYYKNEEGVYKETDIASGLKERFVEVYTDEYQDTDFVQEKILQAVARKSNRFMVGDIKQSIYRFRQARPEIFNHKYEEYVLLNEENLNEVTDGKIILAENFRSRRQVIDSINYIFEKIMSKRLGECSYEEIETLKNGATWYEEEETVDYATKINIIDSNKKENEELSKEDDSLKEIFELEKYEQEAIYIAKEIIKLKKTFKVFTKDGFKETSYKDMVVLLRSIKTKGIILERVLKSYGIPAYCDNSTNLFESDEIKLVLSFLKVLDNPLRDVELVSVLYSIIGKFNLDELTDIKLYKDNKNKGMYESIVAILEAEDTGLSDEVIKKIRNFMDLLCKFKKYALHYTVSELLIKVYKETNLYYQLALEKMADVKKANLNVLVEIAKEYEKNFNPSLNAYLHYLDNIKETGIGNNEAKILGENENVVRIMTIHKSKGLEFPIVILSDTTAPYMERDLNTEVIMHQDLGIGVNIVNEKYGITYPSAIKNAIKNIASRQMKSEELRMLYVAMTRAKEKLVIFASLNDYEKYNSNTFVIEKNGKIDASIINGNKSYFKNINMALLDYDRDNKKLFDINVTKVNLNDMVNDFASKESDNEKLVLTEEIEKLKPLIPKEKEEEIQTKRTEVYDKVSENLNYQYPYSEDIDTASRVSVSALKQEYLNSLKQEEENNGTIPKKIECVNDFKLPSLLQEDNSYTPVRKGILVHFILENLDVKKYMTKESLQEYIESLVYKHVLTKEDKKQINLDSILHFLNSKIGTELKEAHTIWKEQEFILRDATLSKSVIQGVIDLYYLNKKNNIVLVDFKTDRMTKESDYIKKYKIQLEIYKEAIEKITGLTVEKTYIYSFELNKEIEIK
ncbi:MAG: helicase-exonuclease AddAB subunit AddA [Clostridia bacterium]|nr:helicase-exonuclease AddAB subunit AddA [Clostridia bacterium]